MQCAENLTDADKFPGTVDVGPTPAGLLDDMRSRGGMTWKLILGELIDNSLDAGADNVSIIFGSKPKSMKVIDNGHGCPCIEAMLTIGKHHRTATTRLGRYGVGLKDAAVALWGRLDICTTHKQVTSSSSITWEMFRRQSHWRIPTPAVMQDNVLKGTRISCEGIEKPLPSNYESLAEEIGFVFGPGIRRGCQISITLPTGKRIVCQAHEIPQLDNAVEGTLLVAGKQARVRVGIVKPGVDNIRPGISVTHHHRVIIDRGQIIDGPYSIGRICGSVELSDEWRLSTHKDEITQHRDELAAAVTEFCRPVLEQAQRATELVSSAALTASLSADLTQALRLMNKTPKSNTAKSKRGQGDKSGTVVPTGTGSCHANAARKQPGTSMAGDDAKVTGFSIDWLPMDGELIGNVDGGTRIELNENNVQLRHLRDRNNKWALRLACGALLVDDAISKKCVQKLFKGFSDEEVSGSRFSTLLAKLLSSLPPLEE
jgi:hypothetical protein